jgi:hypothetical protein
MIFPDGERRAGFFEINVFNRSLNQIEEYDTAILKAKDAIIPPEFREELEDYLKEKE